MPRDSLHFGYVEHHDVHNAYGYFFHMGFADGLLKQGGGSDMPFVLSRSFFARSQRVAQFGWETIQRIGTNLEFLF